MYSQCSGGPRPHGDFSPPTPAVPHLLLPSPSADGGAGAAIAAPQPAAAVQALVDGLLATARPMGAALGRGHAGAEG